MPTDNQVVILSEEQIAAFEDEMLKQFLLSHPGLMLRMSAVCQAVRVLRDLAYVPKIAADDDDITYQEQAERLLKQRNEALDQCAELHQRLAQVEQERESMTGIMWRFVNAYRGEKALTLGNGQARRSLEEFRLALENLDHEGG